MSLFWVIKIGAEGRKYCLDSKGDWETWGWMDGTLGGNVLVGCGRLLWVRVMLCAYVQGGGVYLNFNIAEWGTSLLNATNGSNEGQLVILRSYMPSLDF